MSDNLKAVLALTFIFSSFVVAITYYVYLYIFARKFRSEHPDIWGRYKSMAKINSSVFTIGYRVLVSEFEVGDESHIFGSNVLSLARKTKLLMYLSFFMVMFMLSMIITVSLTNE